MPVAAFLAPSLLTLGPPDKPELESFDVAGGRVIGWPRRAEDVTVLGPVVVAGLFPIDGGAEGVDGLGVAALEAGSLSHEEKKSSSLGGAGEARGVSSRPSM
jgi:hypothetical protein